MLQRISGGNVEDISHADLGRVTRSQRRLQSDEISPKIGEPQQSKQTHSGTVLSGLEKAQIFWICVNFYIHFGWEMSLFYFSDYLQWKEGWSSFNLFVQAFNAYGVHDRRYRVDPPTPYGSNIDKVVHAVEVPAGIIDGILCIFWLVAILHNKWYRYPVQLVVSALHAFGTVVFWADEFFYGYLSWWTGKGWQTASTNGLSDFGFWWAFIGSNLVWIVVPLLCCKQSMRILKQKLDNDPSNLKRA